MADIERPLRQAARSRLETLGAGQCLEEVEVQSLTGAAGRVDLLLTPKPAALAHFLIAIEIKKLEVLSDRVLGPWIKQCADYVGTTPTGGRVPIAASFVWLAGIAPPTSLDEQISVAGMIQLAQHFRVGTIRDDSKGSLTFAFGPSAYVFRESRNGWAPRAAEYLGARRKLMGGKARFVR